MGDMESPNLRRLEAMGPRNIQGKSCRGENVTF